MLIKDFSVYKKMQFWSNDSVLKYQVSILSLIGAMLSICENLRSKGQRHYTTNYRQKCSFGATCTLQRRFLKGNVVQAYWVNLQAEASHGCFSIEFCLVTGSKMSALCLTRATSLLSFINSIRLWLFELLTTYLCGGWELKHRADLHVLGWTSDKLH